VKNIFYFHGFLGQAKDGKNLPWGYHKETRFHFPDFFKPDSPWAPGDFWTWAKSWNHYVEKNNYENNYLVGYSLGGRLALHALIQSPELYSGAVFISTHPGLIHEAEKLERAKSDLAWSQRFLGEDWDKLNQDWNKQSVFSMTQNIKRDEKDYSRKSLAAALQDWSLSRQDIYSDQLQKIICPTLWLVGENDQKFRKLFENQLSRGLPGELSFVAQAGHRVPFDQPHQLCLEITEFIQK